MRKGFLVGAALALSLFALPLLAQETGVRVFVLRYKRVEEAALLIRPHLSESASVTLTPRLNAMTVTDREEKLRTVAKVVTEFDVPPRGFTFAVKLVRARAEAPAGSISREIGGLGAKLRSVFQFNEYTLIDTAMLPAAEGGSVTCRLGGEYILSFTVGPAGSGEELLLLPLALSRLRKNEKGRDEPVLLYRTPMPVTLNQTLVIGASKEEGSKNALILILVAQETARPGVAEKGTSGVKTVEQRP